MFCMELFLQIARCSFIRPVNKYCARNKRALKVLKSTIMPENCKGKGWDIVFQH